VFDIFYILVKTVDNEDRKERKKERKKESKKDKYLGQ